MYSSFFGSADIAESAAHSLVNEDVETSEIKAVKCFQSFRHSTLLSYHALQNSCWERVMP